MALHLGPLFGEEGSGHVRINFGCSPEVLTEAVRAHRVARLVVTAPLEPAPSIWAPGTSG